MPIPPDIDDLTDLSATGAMLESVLHDWVYEITQLTTPDIPTLAEAIDFFARLTAIRKTLIKLSRLTPLPPPGETKTSSTVASSSSSSALAHSAAPVTPPAKANHSAQPLDPATLILDQTTQLPVPQLDPLPSIPCIPLDQLRPELDNISTKLARVCPDILAEKSITLDASDRANDFDQFAESHASHASHESHKSHESHESHFPNSPSTPTQPWHRKKIPKRFG